MKIVFMGTPEFAVPALEALLAHHEVSLVVTQPDKPAGRKKRLQAPPVKVLAEQHGIPVLQAKSARTPEFCERLRSEAADVAVVVAYGKILPAEVLAAFPLGCLNIHGSLLPKYRGAAPIQRAVINGDSQTGVTIMQLDEGMDTGPVLLTCTEEIRPQDTAGTLFARLAPLGAEAVLRALEGLSAGTLAPVPQSEEGASHAAMLQKGDGLVDWTQSAERIAWQIRGMDPWPGCFTPMANGNLKLFGATPYRAEGAPGQLLEVGKDRIAIGCGTDAVWIDEVQAPGKKRMSAAVFARGKRLQLGCVLSTI